MKKIIVFALLLGIAFTSKAQLDLKKATSTAAALGFDPAKIGKSIMGTLTPKLGLSGDQVSNVAGLINTFLTNKSSFVGQMQSKPAEYKTKFDAEQKTLLGGLKSALKPAQMTQFMGLKPAQTDTANALFHLFY